MNSHTRELHQTRQQLPLLGLLMAVALLLPLWGIGFGLPYGYHVDEVAYVEAALNLGSGEIGRQPSPTGFSNILFIEYGAYFVSGWLTGHVGSLVDFGQAYYSDPGIFILLARLTSAMLGTLNVAVVYWLGRELGGQWVGWVAALGDRLLARATVLLSSTSRCARP